MQQSVHTYLIRLKKKNIKVEIGKTHVLDFKLLSEDIQIEEVAVQAKLNRESEAATISQQKKATIMQESMGAMELSRKGAGDVASGVKKMSGISMMGSTQLFVRGLGDRYNVANLNGMPISSPDPTKKL
ncbi:MAG: hypothetical protein IPO21_18275 [Bacteroidales bacterium]|nr:hypothetical protein [Bacteroidales bacterium]